MSFRDLDNMDNFVFDIPIAAHHPYEQNLSDYDEHFLRDLDAIFGTATTDQPFLPSERQPPLQPAQNEPETWTEERSYGVDPITDYWTQSPKAYSYHTIQQPNVVFSDQIQIQTEQSTTPANAISVSDNQITATARADTTIPDLDPAPTKPYTCIKCSKPFATRRALNCHAARKSACNKAGGIATTGHRCDHCDCRFPTRRSLQRHINYEHQPTLSTETSHRARRQPERVACPLCPQTFTTRNARNQHKRSHHHNGATTPSNRESASDRASRCSFACDQCDQTFAFRTLLNHHRVTEHAPLPRFPCQIGFCDQVYCTAALLKRHEQLVHTDTESTSGQKPAHEDAAAAAAATTATAVVKSDISVRCPHAGCALTFANVVLLRRHQTLHRLRTYHCAPCARDYHSRVVFETHVRLSHPAADGTIGDVVLVADEDLDSGPMECTACGQLFENRRVLRQHRQFCEDEEDADAAAAQAAEAHAAAERRLLLTGKPMAIEEVYVKQEPLEELDAMVMEE